MATFDTPETGKFSIPDDELDPGLRAQQNRTSDRMAEDEKREDKPVTDEASVPEDKPGAKALTQDELVAKHQQALSEYWKNKEKSDVSEEVFRAPESEEQEGGIIFTDDVEEWSKGKQKEKKPESTPEEEQSGQGQEEGNAALVEGNNAIIGELGQILQAVNALTTEIRSGITVKL